jgi:Tol biopolymer transport system component
VRIDGGREVHLFDLSRGVSTYLVSGQAGRVTASGHFLYVNEAGALMGQRLQAGEAVTSGEPAMLLQGVGQRGGGVDIAISSEGTLLYTGPTRSEPERWMWVARDGTLEPFDPSWTDGEFEGLALSPDGTRLAVEMSREGRYDIWIKAVEGGPPSRLTFEGVRNGSPAWTPDGGRVGYVSWTDPAAASVAIASQGDIWVRPADGSGVPELGLDSQHGVVDFQWSADGSWLLATVVEPNPNIIAVRVGSDEEPRLLLGSAAEEFNPALSPDSRWLAYVSDESGRDEVYVVPFPDVSAGKWQISSGGAVNPLWSRDGSELFMRPTERRGMDVADMRRGPAGTTAAPLFELPPDRFFESGNLVPMVDVARDGRFIMDQAGQGDRPGDLILVQNFFEELRRMVP